MKRQDCHIVLGMLGALALYFACGGAHAAKMGVIWVNASLNEDGTSYNDPAFVQLEWGTCVGSAFGVTQATIKFAYPATSGYVLPSGLSKVCVRGYSINSKGEVSAPTNVASAAVPATPNQPVTLGQPIILH